jgi:hypothetical protein
MRLKVVQKKKGTYATEGGSTVLWWSSCRWIESLENLPFTVSLIPECPVGTVDWSNADLTALPANMDNAMVIFNTEDYTCKISTLLKNLAHNRLDKDPKEVIQKKISALIKKSSLPKEVTKLL